MKLYIILGFKAGLSGGQIYVYNKVNYLKKNGWDVCVIDYVDNLEIYINDLKVYKNNTIKELANKPFCYSKSKQTKVIDRIIQLSNWNNKYEKVIVESNTICFSLWGEMLAKRIGAKHVAFIIDAFFTEKMKKGCMDFLDFKLKRKELAGISKNSLKELFKGYRDLSDEEHYSLKFWCTNSVENVKYIKHIDKNKYDFVIGCIGRLNKPYTPGMIDNIVEFAKKYSDKKILLLIIGGQASGDYSVVTSRINSIKNIEPEITGLIYPMPLELIKIMDVCIASSGSTFQSAKNGIKTIAVTDTCCNPLGVIGYSIKGRPYTDYKSYDGTLCSLIEEILINNYCDKFIYEDIIPPTSQENIALSFNSHMKFIEDSCNEKKYFKNDKSSFYLMTKQFCLIILKKLLNIQIIHNVFIHRLTK